MSHWRTYLDSDVIRYVDLDGKDYDVKITAVKRGKVVGTGGKATGKALISFEGREKPLGIGSPLGPQGHHHLEGAVQQGPEGPGIALEAAEGGLEVSGGARRIAQPPG